MVGWNCKPLNRRAARSGGSCVKPCCFMKFRTAERAMDLLLAGNSGTNLREPFAIDQPSDVVLAREPGDQATLVLIHSSHDVVGDPRVEDTRATGHDVHAVAAHDLLQSCTMPRD